MSDIPQPRSGSKSLERLRLLITPLAQLAAIIGIVVSVVVWVIRLQDKVDRLEALVQALATSPPNASGTSTNPLSAPCENLVVRLVDENMRGSRKTKTADELIRLMMQLGCVPAGGP